LKAGFDEAVFYVRMVFKFVWGLLTRQIGPSELGGPVIIGKLAGETARAGFDVLLQFLALLSVNLAVLNVLPIPILDGGHLIFLMIEKVKGSPLSMKARLVAQQVGLAFIIIVMIFVTFNDISRLEWLYKR
jgi:regulator of sigma E protease